MQGKNKTLKLLIGAVVGMFFFSFALVPLYDVFCSVTGLNGKPDMQPANFTENDEDAATVLINFLSHNQQHLPIQIQAQPEYLEIQTGKRYQQYFTVKNLSNSDISIQAIPSVSPGLAANHLNKIECFCFQEQLIPARDSRDLPLEFFINNQLPDEYEEIYLSYTFFEIDSNSNSNLKTNTDGNIRQSDSFGHHQNHDYNSEHEHEHEKMSNVQLSKHKDH